MQVISVPQAVAFAPQQAVIQQVPVQQAVEIAVAPTPTPVSVDPTDVNLRILQVIDPANRSGKIDVPFTQTFDTVGRAEWMSRGVTGKKDISLCMLFQQRRCNAGTKCNQIHAERSLIHSLRQAAETVPRCCLKHGDVHSANDHTYLMRLGNLKAVQLQCSNGAVFDVPTNAFGRTNSFEALLMKGEPVIVVSATRICRLQQRNCCKYGKDCKNIHICREVGKLLPEANPVGNQGVAHFDQTLSEKTRAVVPSLPMPSSQTFPANNKKRTNQRNKRRLSKESQVTNTTTTSCNTEPLPVTPEEIELSGSAKFGKGFTLTESSLKTFQQAFKFPPQPRVARKKRHNQERKRNKNECLQGVNLGNSYGSSMVCYWMY